MYGEEVHQLVNQKVRGLEQYGWLQNEFLNNRGLHYGQGFFGEKL